MGEIRHPQLIGAIGAELAVDPIHGARQGLVGNGCFNRLAAPDTFNAQTSHQPLNRAAGHPDAFPPELMPDLAYAVELEAFFPNTPDLRAQPSIALNAGGRPGRVRLPGGVLTVGRRSDLQHPADRLDSVLMTDRKSTRLNSSHVAISYAVFCLTKKK